MLCSKTNLYTQDILPTGVKYFKEEAICEIITIPKQKPNLDRLLDTLVSPEIEHMNLIETEKAMSNEGQMLTGYKLAVEVRLKQKLTYVADDPRQPVHAAHYESLKGMFVILPERVDDRSIHELLRAGRLSVVPYIENVYSRKLDGRNIHKSILLFLDVKICS